jgi:hypothetical protein
MTILVQLACACAGCFRKPIAPIYRHTVLRPLKSEGPLAGMILVAYQEAATHN